MFKDLKPGIITKMSGKNLLKKIKESIEDKVVLNKELLLIADIINISENGRHNLSDLFLILVPSYRKNKLFEISMIHKNNNGTFIGLLFINNKPIIKSQLDEIKEALVSK